MAASSLFPSFYIFVFFESMSILIIFGVLPGGEDDHRIIFFVKKTSGVASSQLAGDFLVFGFEDDKQVNEPATGQGGVFFDPTGTQLLGGTLYWSDSPLVPDVVQPHAVDMGEDGVEQGDARPALGPYTGPQTLSVTADVDDGGLDDVELS